MEKEIIKNMRKAIRENNLEEVKNITDKYEEVLNEDSIRGTFLHIAAYNGANNIVKYFIEKGIDVNKDNKMLGNAFNCAASSGNLDVIDLLYRNGAKVDLSEASKNPLFSAIYNNHLDVVHYLVEHGIDISVKYNIGTLENVDAYEYARQYGKTEIANYLKECKNNR